MSRQLRALCLLACALLCAAVVVACGSEDEGDSAAAKVISQTFGPDAKEIERGRVDARLQIDPEGLLAIGGPIVLKFDGPFTASTFDLDFAATLAGKRYDGALISTGKQGFVKLDDRTYSVDDDFVSELRGDGGKAGMKDGLGLDPSTWITNPQAKGDEQVGGVDTQRIGGDVNVSKLLEDVSALLDRSSESSFLTPELRKQISDAVQSATVDVWTGAKDRIMRQISVAVRFEFPEGEKPPITGLDAGKIAFRLRLDDVNGAAVKVAAPKNAKPLSRLTGGGLETFLSGLGASLTGAGGGQALLGCITKANGSSVELVRCTSKLAP